MLLLQCCAQVHRYGQTSVEPLDNQRKGLDRKNHPLSRGTLKDLRLGRAAIKRKADKHRLLDELGVIHECS